MGSRALHYVTSDREVNSNRGGLRPVYPPKILGGCFCSTEHGSGQDIVFGEVTIDCSRKVTTGRSTLVGSALISCCHARSCEWFECDMNPKA